MDLAMKTARQDEKHLGLGFGATYIRDLTVIAVRLLQVFAMKTQGHV